MKPAYLLLGRIPMVGKIIEVPRGYGESAQDDILEALNEESERQKLQQKVSAAPLLVDQSCLLT